MAAEICEQSCAAIPVGPRRTYLKYIVLNIDRTNLFEHEHRFDVVVPSGALTALPLSVNVFLALMMHPTGTGVAVAGTHKDELVLKLGSWTQDV